MVTMFFFVRVRNRKTSEPEVARPEVVMVRVRERRVRQEPR